MKKLIKSPFLWIGIVCFVLAFIMPFLGMGGHFRSRFVTNFERFMNRPSTWTMNKVVAAEDREDMLMNYSMEERKKAAEKTDKKVFIGETVYDEGGNTGYVDTIVISTNDSDMHKLEYNPLPIKIINKRLYYGWK